MFTKNAMTCVECGDVRPREDLKFHSHAGTLQEDGTRAGGKVCRPCAEDLDVERDYFDQTVGEGVGEEQPAW